MTTFQIVLILATVLFMFVVSVALRVKAEQSKAEGLQALYNLARKQLGIEDNPEEGFGFTETGKKYLLDEYKQNKRVRLMVNGRILEDMTLAEHENLCVLNGVEPESPVEFRVELGDKSDDAKVTPFPSN